MPFAVGTGIAAALLWGLAFVLPEILTGWSAVAVTAGRYLVYGVLSVGLLVLGGAALRRVLRTHWRAALAFAVSGNVGYYLLLVVGVRTVGAPVTNMIIGCIPVVLAVVGNLVTRVTSWRRLGIPVALVVAGLVLVNWLELAGQSTASTTVATKLFGLLACGGAVALWTWYGMANARFLGAHPEVPAGRWSTVVGVATGAVTVVLLPLAALTGQLTPGQTSFASFAVVAVVLGVVVSWLATWWWNAASARLAPTVAGMLVNVETLSGYAYIYLARQEWPPAGQVAGFAAILTGVVLVARGHRRVRDDLPSPV
jgi:drug/metabolite transporter (DMT)-like permease